MKQQYLRVFLLFPVIAVLLSSCSAYHYDKYITDHRYNMMGKPSRSTIWSVSGRSKTGFDRYDVHSLGVTSNVTFYNVMVTNPNESINLDAMVFAVGIYYKPRFNFFELGDFSSISMDIPFQLILPILSTQTNTIVGGNSAEFTPKGPLDMGLFAPLTFNYNLGRTAQELVRGVGLGVGGGYFAGLMFATDFRNAGPFTHGPYANLNFRFGFAAKGMELGSFFMYSMRHEAMQLGGKLAIMF
jgi:hypothetical protein